jgi:hypothetical protein
MSEKSEGLRQLLAVLVVGYLMGRGAAVALVALVAVVAMLVPTLETLVGVRAAKPRPVKSEPKTRARRGSPKSVGPEAIAS